MNFKYLTIVFFIIAISAEAQNDYPTFEDYIKANSQNFNQYQKQKENDFNAFRRQANAQFAAKMAEAWHLFDMEPPEEDTTLPDPVKPLVSSNEPIIPPTRIKPGITIAPIPFDPPKPQHRPIPTMPEPIKHSENMLDFSFYNTPCKVHFDNSLRFKLNKIDEKSVAAVWQQLSGEASDELIADCIHLINEMQLCDWAAVCLFKILSDSCFGAGSNEAVLMQMYLLSQTGYKARIGRASDRLLVLIPFDGIIYGQSYYISNGESYYDINNDISIKECFVFHEAFPNERVISLRPSLPVLSEDNVETRTFTAKKFPELSVKVSLNKNLISFMNDYPRCRHDNYVYASLSKCTKEMIYPVFRKAIEGKDLDEAANMLLNFMHTAFDYMSDLQQFECERFFFGEESFWFPYNDCEDRAILYCILVRELLGLDVLLLKFPGHIATAIALPMEHRGNYIELNGSNYLFCDPTFIGSNIGEMPKQYRNTEPNIIVVK